MKNTTTASATGVEMPNSTVLSTTWPEASTEPLPGGIPGASTNTTTGVRITLETSHHRATRRKWLTSFMRRGTLSSHDLDEAVHVADRLHRPAEALDVAGGARHEALPAVQALPRGLETELDRVVIGAQRTRC